MPRFYQPGAISNLLSRQGQNRYQQQQKSSAAGLLGGVANATGQFFEMQQRQPYYDLQRNRARAEKSILDTNELHREALDQTGGNYQDAIKWLTEQGSGAAAASLQGEWDTRWGNQVITESREADLANNKMGKAMSTIRAVMGMPKDEAEPTEMDIEQFKFTAPDPYAGQEPADMIDRYPEPIIRDESYGGGESRILRAANQRTASGWTARNNLYQKNLETIRDQLPEHIANNLPAEFDENMLDMVLAQGRTTGQQLEYLRQNQSDVQFAANTDNRLSERQSAYLGSVANILSSAPDQDSYQQAWRSMSQVPFFKSLEGAEEMLALFGSEGSPEDRSFARTFAGKDKEDLSAYMNTPEAWAKVIAMERYGKGDLASLSPEEWMDVTIDSTNIAQDLGTPTSNRQTSRTGFRATETLTPIQLYNANEKSLLASVEEDRFNAGFGSFPVPRATLNKEEILAQTAAHSEALGILGPDGRGVESEAWLQAFAAADNRATSSNRLQELGIETPEGVGLEIGDVQPPGRGTIAITRQMLEALGEEGNILLDAQNDVWNWQQRGLYEQTLMQDLTGSQPILDEIRDVLADELNEQMRPPDDFEGPVAPWTADNVPMEDVYQFFRNPTRVRALDSFDSVMDARERLDAPVGSSNWQRALKGSIYQRVFGRTGPGSPPQ